MARGVTAFAQLGPKTIGIASGAHGLELREACQASASDGCPGTGNRLTIMMSINK